LLKNGNRYVLLSTEIGAEKQVLKALKKIEGVKEAHSLWGVYDIIVHVTADSLENLGLIVSRRISKISKINSKLTMLISENRKKNYKNMYFLNLSTCDVSSSLIFVC